MKKFIFPLLIVTIIAQLSVPSYIIWDKYNILQTGDEYKFEVGFYDPYDPFSGRYVALYFTSIGRSVSPGKYGIIMVGDDGFAEISEITDIKPTDKAYIKSSEDDYFSLPFDRYYMDENLAPEAEDAVRKSVMSDSGEAYVTVKIKNGDAVISGLYIDGTAIEDIVNNNQEND